MRLQRMGSTAKWLSHGSDTSILWEKSAVSNSNFSAIKMSFMFISEAIRTVDGHHQMDPFA